MIEVINDWKIDTYDGGYIAFSKTNTYVDKNGKEKTTIQNPSYFSNLSNALNYVFNQCVKEKIGSHRKPIGTEKVVEDIKAVYADFEKLLAPLKKLENYGFVKE